MSDYVPMSGCPNSTGLSGMSDYVPMSVPPNNIGLSSKGLKSCLIVSSPYNAFKKSFDRIKYIEMRRPSGQAIWFLVNVAVLDLVRRLSSKRCPIVWNVVQSLQLLNFPPLKWIQRCGPLKFLAKGIQALSKPLLFLSVIRTFSDHYKSSKESSHGVITSPPYSDAATNGTGSDSIASVESVSSRNWLMQLRETLEHRGLLLPERFNDDELQRFYAASEGNIVCLQQSLKRTIHWRETHKILLPEELESWASLVFWHGRDSKLRPCLIIRLGLACSGLPLPKPSFDEALISQIEYGVLNLLNKDDPTITVLVDCEGLTPLKFPMNLLRSCATLMQEHYPNRLAALLVIRLPSLVRVVARTFLQVLGPTTRKKLLVGGEAYQMLLSEHLQSIPSFLGGQCTCSSCTDTCSGKVKKESNHPVSQNEHERDMKNSDKQSISAPITASRPYRGNCNQVLWKAVVSFILLWIVFVLLLGIHGSCHLSVLYS